MRPRGRGRRQTGEGSGLADDKGPSGGATGPGSQDWAADLTDRLDDFVTKVRSQTTDRLLRVARIIVFGLVAAVLGTMALVLLIIAAVRAVNIIVPQEVWLAYLIVGGLFTGTGVLLWSKRQGRPASRA